MVQPGGLPVMYYGFYRKSDGSPDPGIITTPQEDNRFPPQVSYNDVTYRYILCYLISTPAMAKQLREMATRNGIEVDVVINF